MLRSNKGAGQPTKKQRTAIKKPIAKKQQPAEQPIDEESWLVVRRGREVRIADTQQVSLECFIVVKCCCLLLQFMWLTLEAALPRTPPHTGPAQSDSSSCRLGGHLLVVWLHSV